MFVKTLNIISFASANCVSQLLQRKFTTQVTMIHQKCRNCVYPRSVVVRQTVPDDKVLWETVYNVYNPPAFTSESVLSKPSWADPDIDHPGFQPKWNSLDEQIDRRSHCGTYKIVNGRPKNPAGRTGISGRGLLGRWGPNHAADPIVTRWRIGCNEGERVFHNKTNLPILQFVSIQRRDTKEWAIPGQCERKTFYGDMIFLGDDRSWMVSKTLQREFQEEAMNSLEMSKEEYENLEQQMKTFFSSGTEVYKGYVDDPRNTDDAWMETVAVNFHDDKGCVVGRFQLCAGDDAVNIQWMDIDSTISLYASHSKFLEKVTQLYGAHW